MHGPVATDSQKGSQPQQRSLEKPAAIGGDTSPGRAVQSEGKYLHSKRNYCPRTKWWSLMVHSPWNTLNATRLSMDVWMGWGDTGARRSHALANITNCTNILLPEERLQSTWHRLLRRFFGNRISNQMYDQLEKVGLACRVSLLE
jgi:hypothetical protein